MKHYIEKAIHTFKRFFYKERKIQPNTLEIPENVILDIMDKLSDFEQSKGFLKKTTLQSLAKKLDTNPKYLSKIINSYYEKNFSTYINELRIQYLLKELNSNETFHTLTIKTLAKKTGFGSTEAFTKAFKKHTGVNPSNYLQTLKPK